MIIKFPSVNRTRDQQTSWDMKFLEIAEVVNFYSTLAIMFAGVIMNLMIIYILKSSRSPRMRAKCVVSSRYPVNGVNGCGGGGGGLAGGGGGYGGSGTLNRHASMVRLTRSLSSSELYMCSLAIVDTIFLVSYLLLNRAPSQINNSDIFQLDQMIHQSVIACKLANYLRYSSRFCSSYFVVFFAYERFKAVRRPLDRIRSSKSRFLTKVFIASVSILSIVINSYSIVFFVLEPDRTDTNRSVCVLKVYKQIERFHMPFQFSISFILPILLVCFFNMSNIRVLLTRKKEMLSESSTLTTMEGPVRCGGMNQRGTSRGSGGSGDSLRLPMNTARRRSSRISIIYGLQRDSNRATHILILISVCFVGLNLPYVIAKSWTILEESLISVAFQCLAEILHVSNFSISFILYCVASHQFRYEFVDKCLTCSFKTNVNRSTHK